MLILRQVSKIFLLGLFSFPFVLLAEEEIEEESIEIYNDKKEPALDCSRETLLSFFPKVLVYKVLKQYDIPRNKWDPIYRDLEQKDKNIIRIVEDKASKMDPNPLKDLKHRNQAVRLFRETLVDSFSSVMQQHGITDQKMIENMLQDIQIEKAKAFAECMEQRN